MTTAPLCLLRDDTVFYSFAGYLDPLIYERPFAISRLLYIGARAGAIFLTCSCCLCNRQLYIISNHRRNDRI